VSWQIVPDTLGTMLQDPDASKAQRVMEAMMKMIKLDIALLEWVYRGE
jgi:predicted 3-demethylubiquinone-9 3-methyltransferase (glyoxalase superfamily)